MVLALLSGLLAVGAPTTSSESRDQAREVVASEATIEGDASKNDRRKLQAALRRGLETSLIEGLTIRVEHEVESGCIGQSACVEELKAGGAGYLVTTRVNVADRTYEFTVEAYDVRDGSKITSTADTCTLCGIAEAEEMLERQSASVLQKLENLRLGPASFTVSTTPAGAQIFVDGELRGTAPLTLELEDGEHSVAAVHPGFARQERALSAVQGTREEVEFKLNPLPVQATRSGFDRAKLYPIGWAALGVGVASLVTGGVFLGLDEKPYKAQCSGDDVDGRGNCRQRYDTLAHGGALVGVGAALAITGTALVVVGAKARKSGGEPRMRARLGPRGGSLQIRF